MRALGNDWRDAPDISQSRRRNFRGISKTAGVDDPNRYYGLGVVCGDYDNDGWPDLYVANDAGPNYLYRNKHDGTFEELGMLSGVALSGDGLEQGSMGVDWGDYLHEGRP